MKTTNEVLSGLAAETQGKAYVSIAEEGQSANQ
jgi:hypothetical protein